MNLTQAIDEINNLLDAYLTECMDEDTFRRSLANIPIALLQDKDSALSMIQPLVENDDMYDIVLKKHMVYPQYIGSFIPKEFWESKTNILAFMEYMIKFIFDYC
jgi:hypothetical protein